VNLSTLKALHDWAKWGESVYIDFPSYSAMFRERALKMPLYGAGYTPEGIAEMEHAICQLSFDQRYLIIQRYCRHLSLNQLGKAVGVSWYRAKQLLRAAESEVHRQYEMVYEMRELLEAI
jgi:DNA-directed RNA polymerase specialized sigma24 family protein